MLEKLSSPYTPRMNGNWAFGIFGLVLTMLSSVYGQDPRTKAAPKFFASVEGHVICGDGGAPARQATVRLRLVSRLLSNRDQPRIHLMRKLTSMVIIAFLP